MPVGSVTDADEPAWSPQPLTTHVAREWGQDRVGTAVAASQLNFARHGDTADLHRVQANAVVLARSDTYADALGGSALAVRKNAPLLITPTGGLDPAVRDEIGRVLAPGGTIYLLGGTTALSPAVAGALSGYTVARLSGAERYATAVAIAKQITPAPHTVLLATGADFPDALAAGATGMPVLLTNGKSMPDATATYLNTLNPDGTAPNGTTLVTVGGPGDAALISGYQGKKMPNWPGQINRIPLTGSTRYATALLVARSFFGGDSDVALATGTSWPDALAGGAMIGGRGGPLLLTDPATMSPDVTAYVGEESGSLFAVHLLGGPNALSAQVEQEAASVIGMPGHVQTGSLMPGGAYPFAVSTAAAHSGITTQHLIPQKAKTAESIPGAPPAELAIRPDSATLESIKP